MVKFAFLKSKSEENDKANDMNVIQNQWFYKNTGKRIESKNSRKKIQLLQICKKFCQNYNNPTKTEYDKEIIKSQTLSIPINEFGGQNLAKTMI